MKLDLINNFELFTFQCCQADCLLQEHMNSEDSAGKPPAVLLIVNVISIHALPTPQEGSACKENRLDNRDMDSIEIAFIMGHLLMKLLCRYFLPY